MPFLKCFSEWDLKSFKRSTVPETPLLVFPGILTSNGCSSDLSCCLSPEQFADMNAQTRFTLALKAFPDGELLRRSRLIHAPGHCLHPEIQYTSGVLASVPTFL